MCEVETGYYKSTQLLFHFTGRWELPGRIKGVVWFRASSAGTAVWSGGCLAKYGMVQCRDEEALNAG